MSVFADVYFVNLQVTENQSVGLLTAGLVFWSITSGTYILRAAVSRDSRTYLGEVERAGSVHT